MGCGNAAMRHESRDEIDAGEMATCEASGATDESPADSDTLKEIVKQALRAERYYRTHAFWDALLCLEELIKEINEIARAETANQSLWWIYKLLGCVHKELHDPNAAEVAWMESLRLNPEQHDVPHMLAALRRERIDGCSLNYVENLFDWFAHEYDYSVVVKLKYSPDELRSFFDKCALKHSPQLPEMRENTARILDLGCGTGLSSVPFRSMASEIVGVDISSEMLAHAENRGIFDKLVKSDIISVLQEFASTKETFHVVLVVDTLAYFGSLDGVIGGISQVLSGHGAVALCTVETSNNQDKEVDYEIAEEGRFLHSPRYIQDVAKRFGLEVIACERGLVRADQKEGVFFLLRFRV